MSDSLPAHSVHRALARQCRRNAAVTPSLALVASVLLSCVSARTSCSNRRCLFAHRTHCAGMSGEAPGCLVCCLCAVLAGCQSGSHGLKVPGGPSRRSGESAEDSCHAADFGGNDPSCKVDAVVGHVGPPAYHSVRARWSKAGAQDVGLTTPLNEVAGDVFLSGCVPFRSWTSVVGFVPGGPPFAGSLSPSPSGDLIHGSFRSQGQCAHGQSGVCKASCGTLTVLGRRWSSRSRAVAAHSEFGGVRGLGFP